MARHRLAGQRFFVHLAFARDRLRLVGPQSIGRTRMPLSHWVVRASCKLRGLSPSSS